MEKGKMRTMEMIHRDMKNGIKHNSNNSNGTNNQAMKRDKWDHHRQETTGEKRVGKGTKVKARKEVETGTHRAETRQRGGRKEAQEQTHQVNPKNGNK